MTRVLWIEFKRSPAKWFAPVVGAVIAVFAIHRYDQWYGVWSQTSMIVQFGTAMAMPVIAAAAGWAAFDRARSGMSEQQRTTSVNPWSREGMTVIAALLWLLLPVVVAYIAISAVSAPAAGSGGLWLTFLWNALNLGALATGYGYFLARVLPSPFTVAAAGFSVGVLIFGFLDNSSWTLFAVNGYPTQAISWPALAVRIGLGVAVLALAIGAGAIRQWSRTHRTRESAAWVAVLGFVAAMIAALPLAGLFQIDRAALGYEECTDTYPRVCLWPEHRRHLPTAAEYVERFNELSEFFVLPDDPYEGRDAFYEEGIRGDVGDAVSLRGGPYGIARGMVLYAEVATDFPGCVPGPDDYDEEWNEASWTLHDWFTAYIMGVESSSQMGVRTPGLATVDDILTLPREDQFQWARQQVAVLKAPCDA
jgi:hypothetical protein